MLHMPKSKIRKISEEYQETGSVINKPRKEYPKKTCERLDLLIVRQIKSNRLKSTTRVADYMPHMN